MIFSTDTGKAFDRHQFLIKLSRRSNFTSRRSVRKIKTCLHKDLSASVHSNFIHINKRSGNNLNVHSWWNG